MGAEESLREGNLDKARAELTEKVKKDPANPKNRVFLFQLLVVLGEWDRALTQLNVSCEMDPGTLPMVQTYQEAIQCEVFREEVFAGKRAPVVFGEPENWIALLTEALRVGGEGHPGEARELRDRAFEEAPATSGAIDEREFQWIADADPRLGPVLEVIVNGRYYWVPFNRILEIKLDKPVDLRDMVWAAAHIRWANLGQSVALLPVRYPGSHKNADPLIRLSRKTDWVDQGDDFFLGQGQRLLATDADEFPLLDVRTITLNTATEAGPAHFAAPDAGEKEADAG